MRPASPGEARLRAHGAAGARGARRHRRGDSHASGGTRAVCRRRDGARLWTEHPRRVQRLHDGTGSRRRRRPRGRQAWRWGIGWELSGRGREHRDHRCAGAGRSDRGAVPREAARGRSVPRRSVGGQPGGMDRSARSGARACRALGDPQLRAVGDGRRERSLGIAGGRVGVAAERHAGADARRRYEQPDGPASTRFRRSVR